MQLRLSVRIICPGASLAKPQRSVLRILSCIMLRSELALGSCSENELYKYSHVLHKTYVTVYTSTNTYGVGNVIEHNILDNHS